MKRRGFTLIELLIASFIGLIVVSGVIALYTATATDVDRAESSYGLEQALVTSVKPLMADLRYTTLASVSVYPQSNQVEDVGLSFLSAAPAGEFDKVEISRFGTPKWQKHVFYTLRSDTGKQGESRLVRYEQAMSPEAFQLVSSHPPYQVQQDDPSERVVGRRLLSPGWVTKASRDGVVRLAQEENAPGGFTVSFLQQDGTSSKKNPTQNDPDKSTGVLLVSLTILDESELGKISSLPFEFRVAPRN